MDTVNVVVYNAEGNALRSITSYPDNSEGNAKAEAYFKRLCISNGCPDEDLDSCLDEGYYDSEEFISIYIAHSEAEDE